MTKHWFWLGATMLVVAWYSSVTIYVAIRGAVDIKHMLRRLSENARNKNNNVSAPESDTP